ncbi:MAG TPA: methyltransferase domain-containing protein [Acidothermaceae bacterium]
MTSCCNPKGYDRVFNQRFARHTATRYRKRGLGKAAQAIVDVATQHGVAGLTILEIGGGVGSIQVELLKRGAAHATNLELSSAYESQARQLLLDNGLAERVERRITDIARHPDDVQPADVVVLHRVVCCYPDYQRLLGAVAAHARRLVVFSHPPRNVLWRAFIAAQNLWFRLQGSDFRVFAHPPSAMLQALAAHGLTVATTKSAGAWRIAAVTR